MMKELHKIGEGDFSPLLQGLTQTASALMQMMPKDEKQHVHDVLNPPDMLKRQGQQNEQDNYNNTDLAPRPGR
jgi:hypothetical protein